MAEVEKKKTDSELMSEALARLQRQVNPPGPCVLCGRGSLLINTVYLASPRNPGKTRAVGYRLCEECKRRPDARQLAETTMVAHFAAFREEP